MAEALLFEHEDGRYAVNPDTTGDPKWHRVGPVDVSALSTNAGEAAPVAYLVSNLPSGEPSLCFEEERGDYGSDTYTPVFEPLFLAAVHGQSASTEGPSAAVERIVHLKASRSMRCYIAGPMTGLPEFNFPAFNAKAAELRAQGWHVENPAEHGHVEGADWGDYLRYDISRIATCEAIFLLPGWSKSKGASLEVHIARTLDMKVCLCEGAESPFATAPAAIPAAPSEAFTAAYMAACKGRAPDHNEIGLHYFRAGVALAQPAPVRPPKEQA